MVPDIRAWLYERRGWLPHRLRKWAEPTRQGQVVLHLHDQDRILRPGEAEWMAAELLLAARDARRLYAREGT